MKVAAIQFRPEFKQRKRNLQVMVKLAEQAAAEGAKLIVLPELSTTGYSFMSRGEAGSMAETLQLPSSDPLSSLAVFKALSIKLNVHIVWGALERSVATGNLFNSQVLMSPSGQFESYSKINFFGQDHCWASPGRANPPIRRITVDGKVHRVGLLICRDVRDKKDSNWSSFYEPGDADVVCLSCNWGSGAFPATAWVDFVKDNKVTLVVSNRYGQEANNDFGLGGVCVIKPDLSIVCDGLEWGKDCIVYAEV